MKFLKFTNITFFFIMLLSPSLVQSQMIDEVMDEIKQIKSKNCNFYEDLNTTKKYGSYQFEKDGKKSMVYGELKKVFYRNVKYKRTLSGEEKKNLLDKVSGILLRHDYTLISKSTEENRYIFQKQISETNVNYLELTIPNTSEDKCEIIFIKGTTEKNYLNDGSFENYRNINSTSTWVDCAKNIFEGNSPPGVHYSNSHHFGFSHPASDGEKYVSLIAREDNTWELIGQKLNYRLEKDSCYAFSIDIRNEDKFKANTRSSKHKLQLYDTKLILTISLSKDVCFPTQKIYTSEAIWNTEWTTHTIEFTPKDDYNFIIFEVNYADSQAGNGNIMMDNISEISDIDCNN